MQSNPTIPVSQGGSTQGTVRLEESGSPTAPGMKTQPLEDFAMPMQPSQPTMVLEKPAPSFAWLAISSGSRAGRLENLNPRGTTIGRDAQNDIVLDDDAISRQHAKLRVEEGARKKSDQFFVYDLGTSNGTFVNGRKITNRVALHDGDVIRVGETELIFKTVEPQAPAKKRPAKKRKPAKPVKKAKK